MAEGGMMAGTEYDRTITALADRLIHGGLADPSDLLGCSEEEIARLEAHYGLRLPAIFRAYLRRMGHGAGSIWTGSDFLYPDLFRLRDTAVDILAANGEPFAFLPTDFVLLMHHDYQFSWFPTGDSDDPPVYAYTEVDGVPPQLAPERLADAFSAWLARAVDDHIVMRARIRQHNALFPRGDKRQ